MTNLPISSQEAWKDIDGFDGYYQISNLGRVKSLTRTIKNNGLKYSTYTTLKGKDIPGRPNAAGYLRVDLYKEGKRSQLFIHILVAKAFIPNPNNLPEVNHKWGIITDNRTTELEWVTGSQNILHAVNVLKRDFGKSSRGKFGKESLAGKKIRCTTNGKIYETSRQASDDLGIGHKQISAVINGWQQSAHGHKFEKVL